MVDDELLAEVVGDVKTSAARLRKVVTQLALGAGGARCHGTPFGPVGQHEGGWPR
jgi:hypothetical protein